MKLTVHSSTLSTGPKLVEGVSTTLIQDNDGNPLVLIMDIPGQGIWTSKLGDEGFASKVADFVPTMRVP